jgi:hypothetical protein
MSSVGMTTMRRTSVWRERAPLRSPSSIFVAWGALFGKRRLMRVHARNSKPASMLAVNVSTEHD